MNNINFRIPLLWLLITVGFILHGNYHLSDMFFGIDIKLPNAEGVVPLSAHIFRVVIEISILLFILFSLFKSGKIFYWISFIWAIILGLLNLIHIGETIINDIQNISQIVLLTYIFVVNLVLIAELWKVAKTKV